MVATLALIQPNDFDLMSQLAEVAAKSGYTGKNKEQTLYLMLKGFELGLSPLQALDGIQIIQGKPTVSPQLMLALIYRSGQLEDIKIDPTDTECTVMMKRVGRSPHTETFTRENAQSMGLWNKDNWKKQPAVMLKWRAVSACARIVFPDVIQGVYSPEEMGAEVSESESGDIVIMPSPTPTLPANVDTETGEIIETPLTVVDAPQSNENAVSSDVPASPALTDHTPAERLGNGNGGKGSITYPATSYRYRDNLGKVKREVQMFYKDENGKVNTIHMNKSIEKLESDGLLDPQKHTVENAIQVITDYKAAEKVEF